MPACQTEQAQTKSGPKAPAASENKLNIQFWCRLQSIFSFDLQSISESLLESTKYTQKQLPPASLLKSSSKF